MLDYFFFCMTRWLGLLDFVARTIFALTRRVCRTKKIFVKFETTPHFLKNYSLALSRRCVGRSFKRELSSIDQLPRQKLLKE